MNLSDKLRSLRLQKKLSATFVAKQLGIAKSTLSNYEKGIRAPKGEMLSKFARLYNTSLDDLFNMEKTAGCENFHTYLIANNHLIPILSTIVSNEPLICEKYIIGYTDLSSEYIGKGDYFGLYVKDDSMNNKRICEGDIVIVRKQNHVQNGEIGVVLIEGQEASIKKFLRQTKP
ncbi:MAG: LexA repressor [Firmicutes bacterium ADurb.Bin193]|nr:MAG: LexA repressor [Firmicutes bacterium ADurb.Bin193]